MMAPASLARAVRKGVGGGATRCGVPVAVTRVASASEAAALAVLFTGRELQGLSARAVDKRRREWLTARALGKYLALHPPAPRADVRRLRFVDSRALALLKVSDARRLEVVTACRETGRAPRLHWAGQERRDVQMSITHAAGWAGVALGGNRRVGLDIESVAVRDAAFYRDFHTASEIAWVMQAPPRDRPLLFTLLWTLKESRFKCGLVSPEPGWAPEALELSVATPGALVADRFRAVAEGVLEPLDVRISVPAEATPRAAFARCGDAVLSLVTMEPFAA